MQPGIQICCPVHGNCIGAKGPILAQLYRILSCVSGLWFSGVAPSIMVNFLCKSEGLALFPSNFGGKEKEKLCGEGQPNFSKQSYSLPDITALYNEVLYPMHAWHCDILEKHMTCCQSCFLPSAPLPLPYNLHAQFTQLVPGAAAT